MIKFFRKIPYDLMEKNKTGKYLKYPIGEIVVVVIGIMIALSINNWNEKLKNKNLVRTYKKNLTENLIKYSLRINKTLLSMNEYLLKIENFEHSVSKSTEPFDTILKTPVTNTNSKCQY